LLKFIVINVIQKVDHVLIYEKLSFKNKIACPFDKRDNSDWITK